MNEIFMKLFKKLDAILTILLIIDILIILASVLFKLGTRYITFILIFDSLLCIVLILNFIIKLRRAEDRKEFFSKNWLDLFASLPLGLFVLPFVSSTLYAYPIIILIRILRLVLLFKLFSKFLERFLESTYLDKIMALFIVIILGSIFALYYFDPNINSLFEAVWYVFQTITTVGYGDIIPSSPIGQFVGLILLAVGVLMFSIFTGSFAYLFNDKVFKEENEEFNQKINQLKSSLMEAQDSINEIKENANNNNVELNNLKAQLDKTEENINMLSLKIDKLIELVEKK